MPTKKAVTKITDQRMKPIIKHSQKNSLAGAELIFDERLGFIGPRYTRPVLMIGYDRNYDTCVCLELLKNGSTQLILVDSFDWFSEPEANDVVPMNIDTLYYNPSIACTATVADERKSRQKESFAELDKMLAPNAAKKSLMKMLKP